jgi:hypothetical protein
LAQRAARGELSEGDMDVSSDDEGDVTLRPWNGLCTNKHTYIQTHQFLTFAAYLELALTFSFCYFFFSRSWAIKQPWYPPDVAVHE